MLFWVIVLTLSIPIGWWVWQLKQKFDVSREARRLGYALKVSHAVYRAVDQLPSEMISRDLRRGLVLLLAHHLEILRRLNPLHPHIGDLELRMRKLNQMPSGIAHARPRSKVARRRAAQALEELNGILRDARARDSLDRKVADLAAAAATFATQRLAVDSARQASKDAENVRQYGTALNFAYQAEALSRALPPLAGKPIADAVAADIERLEAKAS